MTHMYIKFQFIVVLLMLVVYSTCVEAKKDKYITKMPSCYSKAELTKYWISKEGTEDLKDDKHVILKGPANKKIKDEHGKVLAKTNKLMYAVSSCIFLLTYI